MFRTPKILVMGLSVVFIVDTTKPYLVVGKGSLHFDPTATKRRVRRTMMWQPAIDPMLLVVLAPLVGSA